jgi:hypothetical protein
MTFSHMLPQSLLTALPDPCQQRINVVRRAPSHPKKQQLVGETMPTTC